MININELKSIKAPQNTIEAFEIVSDKINKLIRNQKEIIKLIDKLSTTTNELPKGKDLNYQNGSGGSHGW